MTTTNWEPVDLARAAMLIEIRGLHDGWSVAEYEDGSLHNRWPESDYRHAATQEFIDRIEDQRG